MNTGSPPFRIALVDDHPVMLDGYRNMLAGAPDFQVCGTAANAAEALTLVENTAPDLGFRKRIAFRSLLSSLSGA